MPKAVELPTGTFEETVSGQISESVSTKVAAITLYRAKFLSELPGKKLDVSQLRMPNDIDDLEVTDEQLKTSEIKNLGEVIAELSADNNVLNWQHAGSAEYEVNVRKFVQDLRNEIITKASDAINSTSDDAADPLHRIDITQVTQMEGITRRIGEPSTVALNVSLVQLRQLSDGKEIEIMPRENDVVEITLQYEDKEFPVRAFLGFVTAVTASEQFGTVTRIRLECAGMLKQLMVHKMVANRAILTRFESGEILQPGLTPWTTNQFAASTIDEIFVSIMGTQLGMKLEEGTPISGVQTSLNAEAATIHKNLQLLDAEQRRITKEIGEGERAGVKVNTRYGELVEKAISTGSVTRVKRPTVSTDPDELEPSWETKAQANAYTTISIKDVAKERVTAHHALGNDPLDTVLAKADGLIDEHENTMRRNRALQVTPGTTVSPLSDAEVIQRQRQIARISLTRVMLSERRSQIDKLRSTEREKQIRNIRETEEQPANFKAAKINLEFDLNNITTSIGFQTLYIPLITMMILRRNETKPQARFRGKQLDALDLLIRKGFRLFFSEFKTPRDILRTVEETTKHVLYETEDGIINFEVPRYNDFVADTGEDIGDFIITNPLDTTIIRHDADLIARKDTQQYRPFIGPLEFGGPATTRHYTDAAALSRYGLRVTEPVYNPNALDPLSAAAWAAIELTNINATTRVLQVDVDGSKPYQIGRMYYIARTDYEREMGSAALDETDQLVTATGYVGYLVDHTTSVAHGNVTGERLTFTYARKARLVKLVENEEQGMPGATVSGQTTIANYRALPDVHGLVRALAGAIKNGSYDPDQHRDPKVFKLGADFCRTVNTREGGIYVTYLRNMYNFNSLMVLDPPLSQGLNIKLQGTHHDVLPPSDQVDPQLKDAQRENIAPVRLMSVLRVEDGNGGLQQGVVDSLALIDLRLRDVNEFLSWGPQLDTTHKANKSKVFKMVFLPSLDVNPRSRMRALTGMNVTLLTKILGGVTYKTGRVDATKGGVTYIQDFDDLVASITDSFKRIVSQFNLSEQWKKLAEGFFAGNDPVPGISIIGASIRVEPGNIDIPTKNVFAILRFDPHENLQGEFIISGQEVAIPLLTAKDFATAEHRQAIQTFLETNMGLDTATARTQITAATQPFLAGRIVKDTSAAYLPVVFMAQSGLDSDTDATLKNCIPNIPFSLLDINTIADTNTLFYATGPSTGTAHATAAHREGRAVDINLIPYYATTGMVFKHSLITAARQGIIPRDDLQFTVALDIEGKRVIKSVKDILQSNQIIRPKQDEAFSGGPIQAQLDAGLRNMSSNTANPNGMININDIMYQGDKGLYHIEPKSDIGILGMPSAPGRA